jgi:peptidoglycan-associated lipoprotein
MPRQLDRALSLIVAISALMLAGACHKKPPAVPVPPPPPPAQVAPAPPPPPPPPAAQPPAPPAPARGLTPEEIFARMSVDEVNAQKPLDDVFFEFDKSDLSDVARASLQKDATWMKRWTSTKVTIEGHADSRGTNEYNLALGERRATATRDYLVGLGIDTTRLSVVSKGEEQPFCVEENETCWAQNRRGHFIVTAK